MDPVTAKIIVYGSAVIWAILGLVGIIPAGFSLMMFDGTGSENKLATIGFACAIFGFPASCFAAIFMSLQSLRSQKFTEACYWSCLPFAAFAVGAASLFWILIFQHGKFHS